MKTKTRLILTTIISLLLLIVVAAVGLNAVFTVTLVSAEFSLVTDDGVKEAAALKELLDSHVGSSTTFFSLDKISEDFVDFPCFRLESVKKVYPSKIEVCVSERRECFALKTDNGYAILDGNGYCMYTDKPNANRSGGENILLDGFSLSASVGSYVEGTYTQELFAVFEVFEELLTAPRANVFSVTLEISPVYSIFHIQMREGVKIEIVDPAELSAEKARAALLNERGYLSLGERELCRGTVSVVSSGETILVNYDFSRN